MGKGAPGDGLPFQVGQLGKASLVRRHWAEWSTWTRLCVGAAFWAEGLDSAKALRGERVW